MSSAYFMNITAVMSMTWLVGLVRLHVGHVKPKTIKSVTFNSHNQVFINFDRWEHCFHYYFIRNVAAKGFFKQQYIDGMSKNRVFFHKQNYNSLIFSLKPSICSIETTLFRSKIWCWITPILYGC